MEIETIFALSHIGAFFVGLLFGVGSTKSLYDKFYKDVRKLNEALNTKIRILLGVLVKIRQENTSIMPCADGGDFEDSISEGVGELVKEGLKVINEDVEN